MSSSKTLAKKITWKASKQAFFSAILFVDRPLVGDCWRAYSYFRWADDVVDNPQMDPQKSQEFIQNQAQFISKLFEGQQQLNFNQPEEQIVADLIANKTGAIERLKSYIDYFIKIIAFDANRKNKLVSQKELDTYSADLGRAVTDGILYFIGNKVQYPTSDQRYIASTAAHIVHMLRDYRQDIQEGYINIPKEVLEKHNLKPEDYQHPAFKEWVKSQVIRARKDFLEGKQYILQLSVLRAKIVALWYCLRFETILDMIEKDQFELRLRYHQQRQFKFWLRMLWVFIATSIKHKSIKSR